MIRLGEHKTFPPAVPGEAVSLYAQWTEAYGPLVAEQLDPAREYALVRIRSTEFAYTGFDRYLRALGQAWEAGFVPDPLPTTRGRDLPGVAPCLRGVDLDLGDLSSSDVEPRKRRFS